MSQYQGAPRAHVIDVAIAVHIVNLRALSARDKQGVCTHRPAGAYRAIYPTRNYCFSFSVQFLTASLSHYLPPPPGHLAFHIDHLALIIGP